MNEDICKRVIDIVTGKTVIANERTYGGTYCNKPKNPEFIYCDDCLKAVWEEPPRYQCFVEGCPANHPSKYEACHADILPK